MVINRSPKNNGSKILTTLLWTIPSWVLEGIVIWIVVRSLGETIDWPTAIGINSLTIAGQIFNVTPGGIGTYESIMSFLLQSIGFPVALALEIAIITHLLKFLYSYLLGGIAFFSLYGSIPSFWKIIKKERDQHEERVKI